MRYVIVVGAPGHAYVIDTVDTDGDGNLSVVADCPTQALATLVANALNA